MYPRTVPPAAAMAEAAQSFQRALALHRSGKLESARALYTQILQSEPDHPDALHQLGVIAVQTGDAPGGIELIQRSLEITPNQPEAYSSLGNALRELKRPQEALESYERALELDPRCAPALNNRGSVLLELGRPEEALDSYQRALELRPNHTGALLNHGNALLQLGRAREALDSYERAVQLRPDFEPALRAHARTLFALRRLEEALASRERYLLLYPERAEAHAGRGVVLFELHRVQEAIESYDRAIRLNPSLTAAHFQRAIAFSVQGPYAEAIDSYARVLELEPEHPWVLGARSHLQLMQCDWSEWQQAERLKNAVAEDEPVIIPLALCAFTDSASLQLQCARTYVRTTFPLAPRPLWAGERYAHDRIRVAYLSADFRTHPVTYLLTGLLERHDRQRFEITAVSLRPPENSPVGKRVQAAADRFVDVQMLADAEVAQLIRELEIDILVDLQGYTAGTRAAILAQRAAPTQVNFLGFPATMGASYMDYIVADEEVIPAGAERDYAEQVVRLPQCYLPFDGWQPISERVPTRAEAGLPAQGFVFCAFNNHYKITPAVFEIWMSLLRSTPGSVLWLRSAGPTAMANLRREAAARDVAPERLVFATDIPLLADHLARLRLADVFLDTLPYNAHATAAHALWAGVPVVTCRGGALAARVGASMLRSVGLPELIANDLEQYESLALQLAASPPLLDRMRERLRHNRRSCALFDTERYRLALESAYTTMWEGVQAGAPAQSFAVGPPP